jgi:hypothetical protein
MNRGIASSATAISLPASRSALRISPALCSAARDDSNIPSSRLDARQVRVTFRVFDDQQARWTHFFPTVVQVIASRVSSALALGVRANTYS